MESCKPLDLNSTYAYLLLCHHFSRTCVVVESYGTVVAFLSAYIQPDSRGVLFVWQIAVHEDFRGLGIGSRMLRVVLLREECRDVRHLEATVTPSNGASMALFNRFADATGKPCAVVESFPGSLFGNGNHEPEQLLRIGPFNPEKLKPKES